MAENGQDQGLWVVKCTRRRDGKHYYFRHDCARTARRESSMLLDECVARQLAEAIRRQHPDFTARAVPYPKKAGKPCRKSLEHRAATSPVLKGWAEITVPYKYVRSANNE